MNNTKKVISDDITAIREAQQAVTRLADTERTLRQQHAAAVAERTHTWAALASRTEVHAHATRLVDEQCRRFEELQGSSWVRGLSGYREMRGVEVEREVRRSPRLPDLHTLVNTPGALTFTDLCALVPTTMKARLAELIDAQPDSVFGLPEPERQARLAELDALIASIEKRHGELVDAAAAVGVVLPLLDTVRLAREAAATTEGRDVELGVERRKFEAAHA